MLGWLGLRLFLIVEYNTRAVDLERDSATAKIAQRRKSAGTIRQAAWPIARGRAKPPPRTPPPHPCRGRPRRIHPVVEQDQSTFLTYLKKNKCNNLPQRSTSKEDYKKHFHLEHSRPSVKLLPLLIEYQLTIFNHQLAVVNHQLS